MVCFPPAFTQAVRRSTVQMSVVRSLHLRATELVRALWRGRALLAVAAGLGCASAPPAPPLTIGAMTVETSPARVELHLMRSNASHDYSTGVSEFRCIVDGTPDTAHRLRAMTSGPGETLRWSARLSSHSRPAVISIVKPSPTTTRITLDCTAPGAAAAEISLPLRGERWFGVTECSGAKPGAAPDIENSGTTLEYGITSELCPVTPYANARAPFFFTDHNFAVIVRSDSTGSFSFAQRGRTTVRFNSPVLELEFVEAEKPQELLSHYLAGSGQPRLPPDWAFGTGWWRSNVHDRLDGRPNAQANVEYDAAQIRAHGIPASMMIFDRPYGTGTHGWGNFDFDDSFPDAARLLSELQEAGFAPVLWIANRAINSMREKAEHEGWIPRAFLSHEWPGIDLARPESRQWLRGRLEHLAKLGARGFKIDRGDELEIEPSEENRLPAQFARVALDALRAVHGDEAFLFSRNSLGSMQTDTALWGGDTEATWPGLRTSLVDGLRAGLIGYPFWGSDTAGFKGAASKELWARWLEFSALTPLMEVHLCRSNSLLWTDFDDETLRIVREQATLHHSLMPYVRTAMYTAAHGGPPVMRPLFFDFPEDQETYSLNDEYLYGPSLLVAPVVQQGQTARRVYFPAGEWISIDDPGERYSGAQWHEVTSPLDRIPVFVRAGTLFIRGDILQGTTPKHRWRPHLELHLYTGSSLNGAADYFDGSKLRTLRYARSRDGFTVTIPSLGIPATVEIHQSSGKKPRVKLQHSEIPLRTSH